MHPSRSKWRQAYAVICDQIRTGELAPGDRVPTVHELIQAFGMSNTIAQKVHRALREAGLVETESGTGSYVLEGAAEKLQAAQSEDGDQ
ncbi:GntR family transcriptional regulator [Nonomuraea guangzhouensis]|uniref:GntR family transcriptional regulator n=1 Tax=Nonomuraea guangzhouensis TaxID=1291555 RepID=A0ABW4GXH3_9ACTN|nr:winged helix-turn-helix domain-containing protein [Nonomuraea guangzhouensis]